jgi:hypothetical protein
MNFKSHSQEFTLIHPGCAVWVFIAVLKISIQDYVDCASAASHEQFFGTNY